MVFASSVVVTVAFLVLSVAVFVTIVGRMTFGRP